MKTPPQHLTPDYFLVDNSAIELMTTCPWMAWASLVARRTPAGDNAALRFGGHLHAALAYRYRRLANGRPCDEDVQHRILTKRFDRTPIENEEWRNLNMANAVITAYNLEYDDEGIDIPRVKGFPFVEKPFAMYCGDVGKRKIIYIGRIDLVVQEGPHIYVMDHKTTSVLGDTYWKDTAMSEQQRGYCWAYREMTGNEPLGYRMNVLACRKPSKTGTAIEFKRQTNFTKEPPGQLDEWRTNMLEQVATFLWHVDRNIYPRHHKHCVNKYGTCKFYGVCELPDEHQRVLALQSSEFTTNLWSPLYH